MASCSNSYRFTLNVPQKATLNKSLTITLKEKNDKPIDKIQFFINGKEISSNGDIAKIETSDFGIGKHVVSALAFYPGKTKKINNSFEVLADKAPKVYTYKIIKSYPHDTKAYTQGLEYHNGFLYETTGKKGKSSLRKIALKTGEILQKIDLDKKYFGEGMTIVNNKIIWLTWKHKKGFIYDLTTFDKEREFNYKLSAEGWGLTHNDTALIKSDGTNKIWFLDINTQQEKRFIQAYTNKYAVKDLNELEFINGKIYANKYQQNAIVIIDPTTGIVEGIADLNGLKREMEKTQKLTPQDEVLNGIAFDKKNNRLFVTGKTGVNYLKLNYLKNNNFLIIGLVLNDINGWFMRNVVLFFFCILFVVSVGSCRKDFTTIPSFGQITFSKDTVFLDTIFTNIGSATYNLKVYNKGDKNITIPKIRLEKGFSSNYRLNVDGIPGKEFAAIDILANDSIFVFIETTIDINNIPDPLYTDRILFDTGINQQEVDLVTLVQDANFIFPGKDPITMKIDSLSLGGIPTRYKGRFLTDNELTITKEKPTVIYGYAAVPTGKTLTIDAGSKIYFHHNSGLIIDKNASLKVHGTLAEKVIFEGDRLEHYFDKIPGQWGGIWMRPGSKDNEINHAQIKNAVIGVLIGGIEEETSPTLKLENTEIYNHASFGILAEDATIEAHNVVVGNAGRASFAAIIGGSYNFTHSTFANYWLQNLREFPAVLMSNYATRTDSNGQEIIISRDLKVANFTNCIFDGNNNIEFFLDKYQERSFNYNINACLIKFNDPNGLHSTNIELDFNNPNYTQPIILNGNSDFKKPQENDFNIGQESDAINKATKSIFPLDFLGIDRTQFPDIGAYQHTDF